MEVWTVGAHAVSNEPCIPTCIGAPATMLLDTLKTPIGNTARPSVGGEALL